MAIQVTFLGAAQNVTGSRFMIETDEAKVLVDCGLYQERQLRDRNWDPFPVPAGEIDAIVLTHAHLDHCGMIPRLVAQGFKGKIYCTRATAEIVRVILADSAHLQEEDAAFKKRRHARQKRKSPHPVVPLYTVEQAQESFKYLSPIYYEKTIEVAKGIQATFRNVGHILGAAAIALDVVSGGEKRRLVFSGDVGRWERPILKDPMTFEQADYIFVESTYGDRRHETVADIKDKLAEVINSTHARGGNVVIPSFAVERSQDLLYYLNELLAEDRIPHLMTFFDSPMAITVTEIFENHPELFDEDTIEHINNNHSPFELPNLHRTRLTAESKAINHIQGTVIIIAGSGMCTGGRIKHHLVNNIEREESTLLFVGYQAVGTLGRILTERPEEVRILGQTWQVKAAIKKIHGFSGHADKDELTRWLSDFKQSPRRVFVIHGEEKAATFFSKHLHETFGWQTSVPAYGESVTLD